MHLNSSPESKSPVIVAVFLVLVEKQKAVRCTWAKHIILPLFGKNLQVDTDFENIKYEKRKFSLSACEQPKAASALRENLGKPSRIQSLLVLPHDF